MSPGCTKEECAELLLTLRHNCSDVPNGVLESLARNFIFDQLVCLDLADIIYCLSFPGAKLVVASTGTGQGRAITAITNAFAEAEAKGINPALAASALAIVKSNRTFSMEGDYYPIFETLRNSMHPDAVYVCGAPCDPDGDELDLMLIFSGIGR